MWEEEGELSSAVLSSLPRGMRSGDYVLAPGTINP